MMKTGKTLLATAAIALALAAFPAFAQQQSQTDKAQSDARGPRGSSDWGPGMMMGPGMGPGMMGGRWGRGGGAGGFCDPRMAGLAGWRLDRIERAVQPTEGQRAALNDLRAASTKAAEAMAAACPSEFPRNSAQRFAFMEKRMDAMLQSIKIVRPAFDAFYSSLSEEQKARFDAAGPRRWGWR